jgi:hypothetical protein
VRGRLSVVVAAIALLANACAWGQTGGNAARNSSNPIEHGLTTANIGDLELAWQADGPAREPVINSRYVFTTLGGLLHAYALDGPESPIGADRCAGTPATCQPVWSASFGGVPSNPVVDGDQVFVVSYESGHWKLSAFDANATSCQVSCVPRWTATWGAPALAQTVEGHSIAVADGRVYVQTDPDPGQTGSYVTVFDAAGVTGCQSGPPRTCSPLFRAVTDTQTFVPPAVVNQRLFVAATGRTLVFDGSGQTGCSAGICAPLYTLATRNAAGVSIIGSTAYAGSETELMAFDANGAQGCTGTPPVCAPLWIGALSGDARGRPTVAAGQIFVSVFGSNAATAPAIEAFDAEGANGCTGSPVPVCQPRWAITRASAPGTITNHVSATPAVLLVSGFRFGSPSGYPRIVAFDIAGNLGCSGTPKRCTALAEVSAGTAGGMSPAAVAFGHVASTNNPGPLQVFTP